MIRDFTPSSSKQLWVSDITYWKIGVGHVYISFVTDAYSRKIVGYHVAETLESIETIKALKMALSNLNKQTGYELIHHSDRGVQYCQHDYVKLLQKNNVKISMTENGDPLENAIAERINGIIKDEYLQDKSVKDIKQAKRILKEAVELYNSDRPHNSISNYVHDYVHDDGWRYETVRIFKHKLISPLSL